MQIITTCSHEHPSTTFADEPAVIPHKYLDCLVFLGHVASSDRYRGIIVTDECGGSARYIWAYA